MNTREVRIGNRVIGGNNPILIQSMTNTKTEDVEATVAQIKALTEAGCDIIRCAVPNMEAAKALAEIKKQISIPLVADIHFDYKLAIAAMENGADKIRINPGNIGDMDKVKAVVDVAKERNIPIRVGVNSGSLEKNILEKYGKVTAEGIVESALDKVKMIEDLGYDNLVISIKSSDVMMCAKAHELIASKTNYPLHVGITEAGTLYSGNIKSSIGLGIILGGTPQFMDDTRRGLFSYEALKSRLCDSRYASAGYRNYIGPVIRLKRLTDDEMYALISRVTKLYAVNYGVTPRITEAEMVKFLELSLTRAGADEMITPREMLRDYMTVLNILMQNSEITFEDVVSKSFITDLQSSDNVSKKDNTKKEFSTEF